MTWNKTFTYKTKYEHTSSNQHGDRYKFAGTKKLSVCRMEASTDNAGDMQKLILLSHHLDCPVRYDFSDHTASIEVISKEIYDKE